MTGPADRVSWFRYAWHLLKSPDLTHKLATCPACKHHIRRTPDHRCSHCSTPLLMPREHIDNPEGDRVFTWNPNTNRWDET